MSPSILHPDLVRATRTAFTSPRLRTHPAWVKGQLDSARDRYSAQGSFLSSKLDDSARLGLILGSAWLQVRLSSRLGLFEPGNKVTSTRLGSAQLGAWLGLSSCIDSLLVTLDSAWLASGLSLAYLSGSSADLG